MSLNNLPTHFHAMAVSQFGGPQQLSLISLPRPTLVHGQVLIRMKATSINPIDYKTRAGLGWAAAQNKDKLPFVLGYDCFGEVVELGDNVSEFSLGDQVVGLVGFPLEAGAYGEYVVADMQHVVSVSAQQSADICALPVCGLTAQQGLFDIGLLESGQKVVISGAGGAVGSIAVQLALAAGAEVIAVAHSRDHARLALLGAMTLIDYQVEAAFESLDNIDLWFDLIGGDIAIKQLTAVANIKRLVSVPTITAPQVCACVETKGTSAQGMLITPDKNSLTKLVSMVEKQQLKLNIVKHLNYKDAALAHQQLESGEVKGKIALIFE